MQQHHDELRKRVEQQAQRMKKAERERSTLMSQTIYIGTLGLVFVLPVVGGAYLGNWLDYADGANRPNAAPATRAIATCQCNSRNHFFFFSI